MSQRASGYERKERDLYETPEWVTLALGNHRAGNHEGAVMSRPGLYVMVFCCLLASCEARDMARKAAKSLEVIEAAQQVR